MAAQSAETAVICVELSHRVNPMKNKHRRPPRRVTFADNEETPPSPRKPETPTETPAEVSAQPVVTRYGRVVKPNPKYKT